MRSLRRRLECRKRGYGLLPSARIIIALTAMLTVRRPPSSTARRTDFFDIQSAEKGASFHNNSLRTHDSFSISFGHDFRPHAREIGLPAYKIERTSGPVGIGMS